MSGESNSQIKQTYINLALFFLLYCALVITEKQVLRRGYLGFQLPFELNALEAIAGLIVGATIILVLSTILNTKGTRILQFFLVAGFFAGAVSINFYLFRFYYPPFSHLSTGDLDSLGSEKWTHDYPYEMYAGAYQNYYLDSIRVNPEIDGYSELARLERYGFSLIADSSIPDKLDQNQFEELEQGLGETYHESIYEDGSYRFYDLNTGKELALTRYNNMLIFIPLDSIR